MGFPQFIFTMNKILL